MPLIIQISFHFFSLEMDSKKRKSGKKHYNEELIERDTGNSSISGRDRDRQTYSVQSVPTGDSYTEGYIDETVLFWYVQLRCSWKIVLLSEINRASAAAIVAAK